MNRVMQNSHFLTFLSNSQAIASLVEHSGDLETQETLVRLLCGANRYDDMEWSFGTEDLLQDLWDEFDCQMTPGSCLDLRALTVKYVEGREPTHLDMMVTLLGVGKEYIFSEANMIVTLKGRLVPAKRGKMTGHRFFVHDARTGDLSIISTDRPDYDPEDHFPGYHSDCQWGEVTSLNVRKCLESD
jgi:hypothetical protein